MVCSGVRLHLVLFFEIYTCCSCVFFTDLGLLLTRLEPGSDPNQNSEFNWTVEHQDLISDLQLDCCTTAGFAHAGGGSNTKGRSSRRKPSLAAQQ